MARIVEQTVLVTFSRIVKNDEVVDKHVVTDFDLESLQVVLDELSTADLSRVIEVTLSDVER